MFKEKLLRLRKKEGRESLKADVRRKKLCSRGLKQAPRVGTLTSTSKECHGSEVLNGLLKPNSQQCFTNTPYFKDL